MTGDKKRRGGMTAAELMAQLAQDSEFRRAAADRDAQLEAKSREWRAAEHPIIEDLRDAGLRVRSV